MREITVTALIASFDKSVRKHVRKMAKQVGVTALVVFESKDEKFKARSVWPVGKNYEYKTLEAALAAEITTVRPQYPVAYAQIKKRNSILAIWN